MPVFYINNTVTFKGLEKTSRVSRRNIKYVYQSISGVTGFDSEPLGVTFLKAILLGDIWSLDFRSKNIENLPITQEFSTVHTVVRRATGSKFNILISIVFLG